jgi:hypothetical protein
MWPSKKHLAIEKLNESREAWSVLESFTGEGPMIIRLNTGAKEWKGHPSLSIRVGFAIPLNQPDPHGLPDPAENFELGQVEDAILALLQAAGPAIQVLSITTGTFKEFVFHIGNGDCVAEIHQKLQKDITSHDVHCAADQDPDWEVYSSFA